MAKGYSLEDLAKLYDIKVEEEVKVDWFKAATAPYNFVSLPDKPLPSEVTDVASFKSHIADGETFSGEIALDIETLTPMFIGGNIKDAALSFSPLGKPIIPGSSLRGMFKNLFKIVTCGTFRGVTTSQRKGEDFNDEHIYFRCLMAPKGMPEWMEDLHALYISRMEGEKGKNARAGFLIQTKDNKYFIAPLLPNLERKNDYIMMKDFQAQYGEVRYRDSRIKWDKNIAYILTGNQWADKPFKLLDRDAYEKFKDSLKGLTETARAEKIAATNYGKQIIRFVKIEYVDWSKRVELPEDVRLSYEHDRNRRGVNLFKIRGGILNRTQLESLVKNKNLPADVKSLVPCHYLEENGKVTAFGHGQCFRIPYRNAIGDVVPESLRQESTKFVDFADAVFGCEKFWASRVFFDDAVTSNAATLPKAPAHPLMQPNPTSYQLYLKQTEGALLTHWDKTSAQVRGYKMYWHNGAARWEANDKELQEDDKRRRKNQEPLAKERAPLAKGTKFSSKIRFQNLSAVELGALMMIFNLNGAENPAYKIGQGKPFGFGSVKITPTLFVETADAYTKLFDDGGFKNPCEKKSPAEYLKAFKKYVADKNMSATWEKVMEELTAILDWDNALDKTKKPKWSDRIKPIPSNFGDKNNKFLTRAVLPSILEVVR